jgi:ParB-like chromosome segregation protein Spo0J
VPNHKLSYEVVETSTIKAYTNNPGRHSKGEISRLAKNMRRDGCTSPLLLNGSDEIIAGHGRLAAAAEAGLGSEKIGEVGA